MNYLSTDPGMQQQLYKSFRTTGILLLLIGAISILLPQLVSVLLSLFIGSVLILAGLAVAYGTWAGYRSSGLAWLKPFVLIIIGLLIAFNPAIVAAALGVLLVIYFLLTGFASIGFALDLRPLGGWVWMMLNGVLSITLAIIFLAGWPFSSAALIGILVGISFLFDGISLLAVSSAMKTAQEQ
jgi:uncharacterized membrane protein HdeD (DUF308 family)